ncbi:CAP domain-containing protein [Dactylosporangium sp. CA-139066]
MSAFGDGDPDRYDPYAGSPRDPYAGGFDRPPAYGFDGGFGGVEEHTPQHRRGSRMLLVALIGTLALIVVGAVAFAGSLLMSRTSPPKPQTAAATDANTSAAPGDPLGSGDPTENATASAAPTTGAAPTTKATTPKPKTTTAGNASFEAQVLSLVNVERRKKRNCPDLRNNDKLHNAAYKHSADMAKRNYFSHDTPEGVSFSARISDEGYRWSGAAENIAAGQPTPEAVMQAWMNSPGHKANILNCSYVDLGIGLAYQVKGNGQKTPYWTQDFGTPR